MGGHGASESNEPYVYEPWYKYGIGVLFLEAGIAVAVSIFSISMGLSGNPVAFKKHVVFDKKPAAVVAPAPEKAQGMPEQCKGLEQQLKDCLKESGQKP
jgi:hypothetical protein